MWCVLASTSVNRVCVPELKLPSGGNHFALFGCAIGTLLWGWFSDLANGRRPGICIALALIIASSVYQHASNEYIYLASLCVGFPGSLPAIAGVAAAGWCTCADWRR